MNKRRSGILLHITSLPSPYGIGDFGPQAYKYADFLTEAKQCLWQILPLNPTSISHGNSPYSCYSAFAGNCILVSPELLAEEGFLDKSDTEYSASLPDDKVDYHTVTSFKEKILRKSYKTFKTQSVNKYEFNKFSKENAYWLDDYALFVSLKEHFNGKIWCDWPEEIRDREEESISKWCKKLQDRIEMEMFFQYIFYKQWHALKKYCNGKNIQIIGDIPIYVTYDSSDVWAHPELFKLDENKKPVSVAGVPPDYFSSTGQRWGNPVYQWNVLNETRYSWWIKRIEHNLKLFDVARLDHFRGFVAYWEVAADEETAINGKWTEAPVEDFFSVLFKHFPSLPIIAEDLGTITPDVKEIMDLFEFPGMKLLIFAFGKDISTNPYIPHNYKKNCVVYTGTHDNNTIKGWFKNEITSGDKERLFKYLGCEVSEHEIHLKLIRLAMMSVADITIIPMQDILGLSEESRMNLPSRTGNNWVWRLLPEQITPFLTKELAELTEIYGRG